MASTDSTPTSDTGGSSVSWQTAFWTLVPLAINCMTQPCGKVCGLPSRHRTYLRSSPLICLADSLSVLLRLIVTSIVMRISPLESLQALLQDRFQDQSDDDEEAGGLQSLERLRWLRWLFFALGTLPPTIKLTSMSGVPWTMTFGMIYLTSFLVVEMLVIVSTRSPRISQDSMLWRRTPPRAKYVREVLEKVDKCLAILALLIQFVVFYWVHIKITGISGTILRRHISKLIHEGVALAACSGLSFVLLDSLTLCLRNNLPSMNNLGGFFTSKGICCLVTFGSVRWYLTEDQIPQIHHYFFLIFPYIIMLCIVFVSTIWLTWLLNLFGCSLLMSNLAVSETKDNWGTMFAGYLFFCTLFYPLLGYAYVYDPAGTFNPSWTGVFG